MAEDEARDARLRGDLAGLVAGGVPVGCGARSVAVPKGRLVNEDVRTPRQGDERRARARVATIDDRAPLGWRFELHAEADVGRPVLHGRGENAKAWSPEERITLLWRDLVELDAVGHLRFQGEKIHESMKEPPGFGQGVHVQGRPTPGQT